MAAVKAVAPYPTSGWEIVAAALVLAVVSASMLAVVHGHVVSPPQYPDFIVGALAWGGDTKSQDLATLPALLIALAATMWLYGSALRRLHDRGAPQQSRDVLVEHVLLWSIPAVVACAYAILGDRVDAFLLLASCAGLVALLATTGRQGGDAQEEIGTRSLVYFGAALLSLLPLELALVAGRLSGGAWDMAAAAAQASRWAFPLLMACAALALSGAASMVRRLLPWLLLIAQFGALGFYLVLLPARLLAPDGTPEPFVASIGLMVTVAAIVAFGAFDVVRRMRGRNATAGDPASFLSPIAIFGLLVALRCGNTSLPILWTDDYHAGESMLGWWSLLDFGRVPYRDYFPARGLVADDLPGIVGRLFYDGTAASLPEAKRLSLALLSLPAFLCLHWRTKSLALAFVSVVLFGVVADNLAWLLLVPFLCLMLSGEMSWRSVVAWASCAAILVVAAAAQGVVLAAATSPAVLLFAWQERSRLAEKRVWIGAGLAIIALLGILTPLPAILFGAARYVLENGAVNQVAWGVPWHASWAGEGRRTGIVFEAIRMSWLVVPIAAAGLALWRWREMARPGWVLAVAIPVVLFFVALSPYAMGRIDPSALSRAGIFSNFAWAAIVPLLLFPLLDGKGRALLVLVVAGACSAIGLVGISRSSLDAAARPTLVLPAAPVDGAAAGMPNVGRAIVDSAYWDRLRSLKRTIDEVLPPGETYLDLTNRNAQHFYLGRPPAMAVSAPFNMTPVAQQRREVEALRRNPPRIALIEAENAIHDGGGLALRTPLVYRFVMDSYEPEWRNGFVIGRLRTTLPPKGASAPVAEFRLPIRDYTDVNWNRGVSRTDAAVVVDDATLLARVSAGDSVKLPGGEWRIVKRVWPEGSALWLEGAVFGGQEFLRERSLTISVGEAAAREHALALWDKAFRVADLRRIPSAWGRSWHSLESRVGKRTFLDHAPRTLAGLSLREGALQVSGPDPWLSLDIGNLRLSGRDAGLLGFEFTCTGRKAQPRLQVFWWGAGDAGPREAASAKFLADDGLLIVPLDAYPRWLTLHRLGGLRIDLDTPGACSGMVIGNIWLAQRASLAGLP